MHWGACCLDIDIPMPMHIWETESNEEKDSNAAALEHENNMLKEEARGKQRLAQQPGTQEHHQLAEINDNIQRLNTQRQETGEAGRKGYKRLKKQTKFGSIHLPGEVKAKAVLIGFAIEKKFFFLSSTIITKRPE